MKGRPRTGTVRRKINGKSSIKVKGEWYDWNRAYRVYNRRKDYEQLRWSDLDEGLG